MKKNAFSPCLNRYIKLSFGLLFGLISLNMLLISVSFANPTPFRICTGSSTGHYYRVGQIIAKALSKEVKVSLIETKGSWENLGRIHSEQPQCDAIIAQDDATAVYLFQYPDKIGQIERVIPLYKEYIQFLCNQEVKTNKLSELDPDTRILTGSYGTGTFITWTLIKQLNSDKYGVLRELETGGEEALKQMINQRRPQCLLTVNALAQGIMVRAHDDLSQSLKLLNLDDPSFQKAINQAGVPRVLYQRTHLHKNIYPLLLEEHLETQTVEAVFFVHSKWMQANPALAESLSNQLIKLQRNIQGAVD